MIDQNVQFAQKRKVMVINNNQIKALDAIPLGIFFEMIEDYIKDRINIEEYSKIDLKKFIADNYQNAIDSGNDSEIGICMYVLDKLKLLNL